MKYKNLQKSQAQGQNFRRQYSGLTILILSLISICYGCKSTGPSAEGDVLGLGESAGLQDLALDPQMSQEVYLQMVAVEVAKGLTTIKGQARQSYGVFDCHKSASLENCALRVRVSDAELSAPQAISEPLMNIVNDFSRSQRAEIKQFPFILSDVQCEYFGEESPPFEIEKIKCFVRHPRTPDEAIFEGSFAEDLATAIRGDESFGDTIKVLHGSLVCQWSKSSPRTPCFTRSIVNNINYEKVVELPQKTASKVATQIMRAAFDQIITKETKGQIKNSSLNITELSGSLTCYVDASKKASFGRLAYLCRARVVAAGKSPPVS